MHFDIVIYKLQMINTFKNAKITRKYSESNMKKRFHLLIIIGLLLVGFVIGSFRDLQIDQAIFDKNNGFGLFMASFGVYPCYAGLAFIGGGFLCTSIRRKELPQWAKIICYILSFVAYGLAIYLCGDEMPSANGYNNPKLAFISYPICAVVFAGAFVGGYMVCRKGDQKQLWIILLVMTAVFLVGLLPAGFLIKLVIHRPRYRYAVRCGVTDYCNWWQSAKNYKDLLGLNVEGFEITKEEFKSFPSGHSGNGMMVAVLLSFAPFFFPKLKGKEVFLFYGGVVFAAVMMFSRLLVGAHYLSDTCMGSLIVLVVFYIVNEFAYRKGFYNEKEIEKKEEAPALE